MEILRDSLLACTVLIIWFETNAFYEYCRALGLGRFFKGYKNFIEEMAPSTTFVEYLMIKHDCFFIRLISCPICLGVWVNIIIVSAYLDYRIFFINFYLSLVSYFLLKALIKLARQ
jgi:hypothetical protein